MDEFSSSPSVRAPVASVQAAASRPMVRIKPRDLRTHLDGLHYLESQFSSGRFASYVSPDNGFHERFESPPEMFSTAVIMDLLATTSLRTTPGWKKALELLHLQMKDDGTLHFFQSPSLLPADVDCTAIGLMVLRGSGAISEDQFFVGARRVVNNTDSHGRIETYFETARQGRVDPIVCCNALRLLSLAGLEHKALPTLYFVRDWLRSERFEGPTRYYPSPDAVLYFASMLFSANPIFSACLLQPLRFRILERLQQPGNPLELAMRQIAFTSVDLRPTIGLPLCDSQLADGGWPALPFFKYGRQTISFGSPAITTAFMVAALRCRTRRRLQNQWTLPSRHGALQDCASSQRA